MESCKSGCCYVQQLCQSKVRRGDDPRHCLTSAAVPVQPSTAGRLTLHEHVAVLYRPISLFAQYHAVPFTCTKHKLANIHSELHEQPVCNLASKGKPELEPARSRYLPVFTP